MNVLTLRSLLLVLVALALGGCGAVDSVKRSVGGLLGDDSENTEAAREARERAKPRKLGEFLITHRVRERWSASVGSGTSKRYLKLHPVTDGDRVYGAEFDGDVRAFGLGNGRRLWSVNTKTDITGGPGVGDGLVVVGSRNGEVTAISTETGVVVWRAQMSSEVLAAPVASRGMVVVRSADGRVFGLDANDGRRRWTYDRLVPTLSLRGNSAPVIVDAMVLVGFDNGRVEALDLLEGKVVWEASVAVPRGRTDLDRIVDIDGDLTVADGVLYVASYQGKLAAFDVGSGRALWTHDISSYSGVAVDGDYVFVSDDAGDVWCIDRNDGNAIWRNEGLRNRGTSAPAVAGQHVVVGDAEGYVHWLDVSSGEFAARDRADSSAIIAAPLVVGDEVIVYTSGGDLTAYGPDVR